MRSRESFSFNAELVVRTTWTTKSARISAISEGLPKYLMVLTSVSPSSISTSPCSSTVGTDKEDRNWTKSTCPYRLRRSEFGGSPYVLNYDDCELHFYCSELSIEGNDWVRKYTYDLLALFYVLCGYHS